MNFLLVFLGGGLGSVVRYLFTIVSPRIFSEKWAPVISTISANALACIFLALVVKGFSNGVISKSQMLLIATGFCGGFSTFSTFSLETFMLWNRGDHFWSIANVLISVALGWIAMAIILKEMPSA